MIRVNTPGLQRGPIADRGCGRQRTVALFNTQAQVETIDDCPFIRVQVCRSRVKETGIDPVTTKSVQYLIKDCRDGADGEIVAHARQIIDDAAYVVDPQTGAHSLLLDMPIAINVRWRPNAESWGSVTSATTTQTVERRR